MRQYVARPGQECESELIVGANNNNNNNNNEYD